MKFPTALMHRYRRGAKQGRPADRRGVQLEFTATVDDEFPSLAHPSGVDCEVAVRKVFVELPLRWNAPGQYGPNHHRQARHRAEDSGYVVDGLVHDPKKALGVETFEAIVLAFL